MEKLLFKTLILNAWISAQVRTLRHNIQRGDVSKVREGVISVTQKYPGKLDLNAILPKYGMSLFHMSVGFSNNSVDVVKVLLDHGGDPNNMNCLDKVSPVHLSVLYKFHNVLELLLKNGGDPFVQDGEGKNCYELAKALEVPVLYTSYSESSSIRKSGGSSSCRTITDTDSEGEDTLLAPLTSSSAPEEYIEIKAQSSATLVLDQTRIPISVPLYTSTPMTKGQQHPKPDHNRDQGSLLSSISLSSTLSAAYSIPSIPPSPTNSKTFTLEASVNVQSPVPISTYNHSMSSNLMNTTQLTPKERLYSPELQHAIQDLSVVERLKYGELMVEFAQDAPRDPLEIKSYYSYILLDPKIVKRINFSGDHLKSRVINNSDKFRKFVSGIFHIGMGCGKRPNTIFDDAKSIFKHKDPRSSNVTIKRIAHIWESCQGVIVFNCCQHLSQGEASVNEAAMIDAMGLKELSSLKGGPSCYSGMMGSKWSQRERNNFGVLLLRNAFSQYAVNVSSSGRGENVREVFYQDV